MNYVYKLLPDIIPDEIQDLIYLTLGICTPSCKVIKECIKQYKSKSFVIYNPIDTLWSYGLKWHFPRYLSRNVCNSDLSNPQHELKMAYILLQFEYFVSTNTPTSYYGGIDSLHSMHSGVMYHLKKAMAERFAQYIVNLNNTETKMVTA